MVGQLRRNTHGRRASSRKGGTALARRWRNVSPCAHWSGRLGRRTRRMGGQAVHHSLRRSKTAVQVSSFPRPSSRRPTTRPMFRPCMRPSRGTYSGSQPWGRADSGAEYVIKGNPRPASWSLSDNRRAFLSKKGAVSAVVRGQAGGTHIAGAVLREQRSGRWR